MCAGGKKGSRRSHGKKKKRRAGKELLESRDGVCGRRWTVRGCSRWGEEREVQEEVVEEEEEGRRDKMMIGRAVVSGPGRSGWPPCCRTWM